MTTPSPEQGPPSRRLWAAGTGPAEERTTSRLRRIVEGLPEWSPLPPGEQLVRRPGANRRQS
ncbi:MULTISPECIES: hypothetical protein [unclassified Streptomyces]|uniref:hypothetical protein n=1 Tax=unclassified Streptomyces TaxID=2593676 RepID=UPI00225B9779|nr:MULTISPECIES: hypothetical protein [unclassified Streptomyces]MCX4529762.1 hypothetical protein [Streptomyces sp. NBC_01551]MCX4539666.1 hypothetical protein [Streptomyces sp. NBC_01565]